MDKFFPEEPIIEKISEDSSVKSETIEPEICLKNE